MTRTTLVQRRPRTQSNLPGNPMSRHFERLFGDDLLSPLSLMAPWRVEDLKGNEWLPAIDIRESEEAYIVTAELPGLSKEDVEITVEDRILVLKGERRFDEENKADNYHRIERSYGSFSRSFTLPNQVDQGKVVAQFKDGLLTISLPKSPETRPRSIAID